MFGKKDRNNFETYEDFEAHPVGKHILKMPYLWEEGEYPKKASELAQASSVIEAQPDPLPAVKPVEIQSQIGLEQKTLDSHLKTFSQLEPKPDAWWQHQQSAVKSKPITPLASTFSYNDVGQMMKPVSDAVIDKFIDPVTQNLVQSIHDKKPVETTPYRDMVESATPIRKGTAKAVVNAVKNKQSVRMAEQDLIDTARAVKNTIGNAYSKDNYEDAMDAIRYGEGLGHADDMENSDSDALTGFKNTWNEGVLGLVSIWQMGNKFFDPEGKNLPTKEFGQWIRDEEKRLKANKVPDLLDFTKLDWKNNPDKVIQLGGKYFRESLLGTHLFGFAVDAMKGRIGPLSNQIVGTVIGIARFYNATDDIMAAVTRGTAASSAENWDFVVGQLTKRLPRMSRVALSFMNSVLSKDLKAKMFNSVLEQYRTEKPRDGVDTR